MKSAMTWTPAPHANPATPRSARCPESGRTWIRINQRDECPHCGRMVTERDGATPEHAYPRTLRH